MFPKLGSTVRCCRCSWRTTCTTSTISATIGGTGISVQAQICSRIRSITCTSGISRVSLRTRAIKKGHHCLLIYNVSLLEFSLQCVRARGAGTLVIWSTGCLCTRSTPEGRKNRRPVRQRHHCYRTFFVTSQTRQSRPLSVAIGTATFLADYDIAASSTSSMCPVPDFPPLAGGYLHSLSASSFSKVLHRRQ